MPSLYLPTVCMAALLDCCMTCSMQVSLISAASCNHMQALLGRLLQSSQHPPYRQKQENPACIGIAGTLMMCGSMIQKSTGGHAKAQLLLLALPLEAAVSWHCMAPPFL